jgi:hypothetical protein
MFDFNVMMNMEAPWYGYYQYDIFKESLKCYVL